MKYSHLPAIFQCHLGSYRNLLFSAVYSVILNIMTNQNSKYHTRRKLLDQVSVILLTMADSFGILVGSVTHSMPTKRSLRCIKQQDI